MTLFRSRTVAFIVQVAYWILRVVALAELVNHVNIDQRSGDMHGCGILWAGGDPCIILVSSARLHDQSSRKVRVRPLLTETGTRQRYYLAAVTDHNVYAF